MNESGGDPLQVLRDVPTNQPVMLLHSGRYHPRWASRSIMAQPMGTYQFTQQGQSRWLSDNMPSPVTTWSHKPFADLRQLLAATRGRGVWVGYLSYDLGRWIETLPAHAQTDRDWPIVELGWCPCWWVYDLAGRSWSQHGTSIEISDQVAQWPGGQVNNSVWQLTTAPQSLFTPAQYQQAVQRVKDYIAAGDVFQVNLAQRFTATGHGSPRDLFHRLAATSPAWYGAYLELCDGRALASTSPELFLQVDAQGQVITRPIKGTRPADQPVEALRDSDKDIAEINMIVDLLRNDLGRVCAYGSMQVAVPREIETHPTVHHGVATITGRLHENRDIVDLLRATMPGGSITGAPKIRAMQIIDELEPVRRGPYCGAIGWLTADELCLNIAIRTLQLSPASATTLTTATSSSTIAALSTSPGSAQASPGTLEYTVDFSVGGGIVADSDPLAEYHETLTKAAALMKALGFIRQ